MKFQARNIGRIEQAYFVERLRHLITLVCPVWVQDPIETSFRRGRLFSLTPLSRHEQNSLTHSVFENAL
ncbi:MAG: hypothetical protein KC931_06595, partial [Candidatus Omnitrophica bacterium]|nr:hypothetical protein [Candidatus Omnitrophota bacterium]